MTKTNRRLTRLEMGDVHNDFVVVVEDALAKLSEKDRPHVEQWRKDQVAYYNVHYIFRPDKAKEIHDLIFSDVVIRDFLFEVQFRFYVFSGQDDSFIDKLCANLEDALTIDGPVSDYNTLPGFLRASLPLGIFVSAARSPNPVVRLFRRFAIFRRTTTIHEFLRNNPLLVVILMLNLVYREESTGAPALTLRGEHA